MGRWVSESLIVSDLEIDIASSSFASLFYSIHPALLRRVMAILCKTFKVGHFRGLDKVLNLSSKGLNRHPSQHSELTQFAMEAPFVFNWRQYSSMVATKCQAAPIYDLLWIAVSNQVETVALFESPQTNLFQRKRSKGKWRSPQNFFPLDRWQVFHYIIVGWYYHY